MLAVQSFSPRQDAKSQGNRRQTQSNVSPRDFKEQDVQNTQTCSSGTKWVFTIQPC